MTAEDARLHSTIAALLQASAVTFYEALTVLHLARHQDTLDAPTCAQLIRLHDASHTTDGARAILQPFLAGQAKRLDAQLTLGKRTILFKDSGKTVRMARGQVLTLQLQERRASGYRWEVCQEDAATPCSRYTDRADSPNDAFFSVEAAAAGVFQIELREVAPTTHRHARPRRFRLRLIVEGG